MLWLGVGARSAFYIGSQNDNFFLETRGRKQKRC
nr:MAG TPA: hypothetical protein [Caudoviricetes sp.]